MTRKRKSERKTPKFKLYDGGCPGCIFLGRFFQPDEGWYDMYVHFRDPPFHSDVSAYYGREGWEYLSCFFPYRGSTPVLKEASRRALLLLDELGDEEDN